MRWQFFIVTPVLPSRMMPSPAYSSARVSMTLWPAPSRVMLSAAMMILPKWSSVRVVSSVITILPVVPQAWTGRSEKNRRGRTHPASLKFVSNHQIYITKSS